MLSASFASKNWMCATEDFDIAEWIMVGIPYDGTCSYRPGTRFGPEMIRLASWGIETYSPVFDKDFEEVKFFDAGELDLPFGNRAKTLSIIKNTAKEVYAADKKWFGIGGEHLVTLPSFEACFEKYNDIAVVHFDAHADLRDNYMGEKLSHATVIRRISDFVGLESIVQVGIRSGPKFEFDLIKKYNILAKDINDFSQKLEKIKNRPVYLTIDLDVLDPSVFCGTGTPEPDGFSFTGLINYLKKMTGLNIAGIDVVEFSPHYDLSGVSAVVAAKLIRNLFLLFN